MRILIVEDDPLLRMLIISDLEDGGFEVAAASTAAEALAMIQSPDARFDGVVTDVRLPDRSGDLLAADIRKLDAELPVIIASGYDQDVLRPRVPDDGRTVLLGKPFGGAQLKSALGLLGLAPKRPEPIP